MGFMFSITSSWVSWSDQIYYQFNGNVLWSEPSVKILSLEEQEMFWIHVGKLTVHMKSDAARREF
jgi:hypothetical protein